MCGWLTLKCNLLDSKRGKVTTNKRSQDYSALSASKLCNLKHFEFCGQKPLYALVPISRWLCHWAETVEHKNATPENKLERFHRPQVLLNENESMRNRYARQYRPWFVNQLSPRLVKSQWGSIYFKVSHTCGLVPPIFPKRYLIRLREDKSKANRELNPSGKFESFINDDVEGSQNVIFNTISLFSKLPQN